MQTRIRFAALVIAVATSALGCSAQADQITDKIRSALQTRLGIDASDIKGISKAPMPGLYEINLGTQIVYSDANGDYVLNGELIDTKAHRNLTEARLNEINKVDFAKLPFENAVKVVKGDGKRKMAVFSDPNCPYCHQLESTLKSVDNVTVYTFLYPVLSPDSTAKAKQIWCSSDRAKAWESWMVDRKLPTAAGTCDTAAIDSNLALGQKMNVTGTPTVILADGTRLPGAVSAHRDPRRRHAPAGRGQRRPARTRIERRTLTPRPNPPAAFAAGAFFARRFLAIFVRRAY